MPRRGKRERSPDAAASSTRTSQNRSSKRRKQEHKVHWGGSVQSQEASQQEDDGGVEQDAEEDVEHQEYEEEEESIEEEPAVEQVCIAMTCNSSRLGAAFFDSASHALYLLEDTEESSSYDLAIALLEQTTPEVVLTGSKADENFQTAVRNYCETNTLTYTLRPSREFNPLRGPERLLALPLFSQAVHSNPPSSPSSSGSGLRNAYEFMRGRGAGVKGKDPERQMWEARLRLGNWGKVDGGAALCMGAAAALLDHLVRTRVASGDLEDEGVSGLDVLDIKTFTMEGYMQINADALSSLQVFNPEQHASMYSDRSKESLSLYGILLSPHMPLTPALLRRTLLRPLTSIPAITARYDALDLLLHPSTSSTVASFGARLKGLGGAGRAMKLLGMRGGRGAGGGVKEWMALVRFAYEGALLREGLLDLASVPGARDVEIVKKLLDSLEVAAFKEMGAMINETIDWDASQYEARVVVRARVDETLDNVRNIYHGLDSLMSRVAIEISRGIPPDFARELNVCYYPQLGYLITIPLQPEWQGEEDFERMSGWTFQFMTEEKVYFKSQEMRDMDHAIGDVFTSMVDREIEIIQSLKERVAGYADKIHNALLDCAELDCLLGFAQAARTYEWRRPRLVEDNVIDIRGGRHPLQELCVESFVPNDCQIAGGKGLGVRHEQVRDPDDDETHELDPAKSVIVLTGANACGKSVYLKQTALIVLMAQVDAFVPAEQATIGIVDKIFTRCQTKESVSKLQSAFMIDLSQVSLALRNCTSRSLIILDEFGKGTRPSDGAGLFCGTLDYLVRLGPACPKVLAATHFHEIFTDDILLPDLPIHYAHMQIVFSSADGELIDPDDESVEYTGIAAEETITYLYRYYRFTLASHATRCALLNGVPRRLVDRADHVTRILAENDIDRLLDEELTEKDREELEEAEGVMKRYIAWDLEKWRHDDKAGDMREELKEILGRLDLTVEGE